MHWDDLISAQKSIAPFDSAGLTVVAIIDPTNGKANLKDGVVWRPFSPKIYHELALIRASDQELGKASAGLYNLIDRSLQSLIGIGNAGESYE